LIGWLIVRVSQKAIDAAMMSASTSAVTDARSVCAMFIDCALTRSVVRLWSSRSAMRTVESARFSAGTNTLSESESAMRALPDSAASDSDGAASAISLTALPIISP
jgi:hypothetical protein